MSFRDDLNHGLSAFGVQIPESVQLDELASRLGDYPCRNTVSMVAAASLLFYMAERGRNPKVRDIYDSLVYCTTNLSVGYCDIFARTPIGKLVGSVLMTMGPAMAAKTLDGPKQKRPAVSQPAADGSSQEVLATLKQILHQLQARSEL
jgi:hypothetical protein